MLAEALLLTAVAAVPARVESASCSDQHLTALTSQLIRGPVTAELEQRVSHQVELCRKSTDSTEAERIAFQMRAHLVLGALQRRLGQLDEALDHYQRVVGLDASFEHVASRFLASYGRCEVLTFRGEFRQAEAELAAAFALLDSLRHDDQPLSLDALRLIGIAQGIPLADLDHLEALEAQFRPLILGCFEGLLLQLRAALRRQHRKHEAALADLQRADRLSMGLLQPLVLPDRVEIELQRDNPDAAEAALRRVGDLSWAPAVYRVRLAELWGVLYQFRGDYGRAEDFLNQAYNLAQASGNSLQLANLRNQRGCLDLRRGDVSRARIELEQALRDVRQLGAIRLEMAVLHNLAMAVLLAGDHEEAVRLLLIALELVEELEDPYIETFLRLDLSRCYLLLDRLPDARSETARALASSRKSDSTLAEWSSLMHSLALEARRPVPRWPVIEAWIGEADRLVEKLPKEQQIDQYLARAFLRLRFEETGGTGAIPVFGARNWAGLLEDAHAARDLARRIDNPGRLAWSECLLGLLFTRSLQLDSVAESQRHSRAVQAQTHYDAALEIFEAQGRDTEHFAVLAASAPTLSLLDPDAGLQRLREAEAKLEGLRLDLQAPEAIRSFFGQLPSRLALVLVQQLLDRGENLEAFEVAERARARSFLNALGYRWADDLADSGNQRLALERDYRRHLSYLQNELDRHPGGLSIDRARPSRAALLGQLATTRQEYQQLILEIQLRQPRNHRLLAPHGLDASVVRRYLPAGSVLVAYFLLDDEAVCWLLDAEALHTVRWKLDVDALRRDIAYYRRLLAARVSVESIEDSLREQLFEPMLRQLEASKAPIRHLHLVPAGPLHFLPFAALRQEQDGSFADRYTLSLLPSASSLVWLPPSLPPGSSAPRHQPPWHIFANADGSLQAAEDEAWHVAALAPALEGPTFPWLGTGAREADFQRLAPGAAVLHLATHGIQDRADPAFSYLQLAPDEDQDGRLSVHEIAGLDLQSAPLIVLSACETSLGSTSLGDDLISLPRAFLEAGGRAVVSTLWKVEDEASRELMLAFYRHLDQGCSVAEALQAAQAYVRNQEAWSAPYYWAGFQVTGMGG